MITIIIGKNQRVINSIRDLDESWINQQVNRRQDDGCKVCVQVNIDQHPIDVCLSTPACAVAGGGGRRANSQEVEVFDLWEKNKLKQNDFTGGNVVAFFKQLRKLLN